MKIERLAFWELYPDLFGWSRWFVYIMATVAMGIFAFGIFQRIRLWRQGKNTPTSRLFPIPERLKALLFYGFLQIKIIRKTFAGIFHSIVFWGFAILFVGTSLTFLDEDFYRIVTGHKFIQGPFYVGFSWLLDLAGFVAVFGIGMALWRRYLKKSDLLDDRKEDSVFLLLILGILITGFLSEGLRISHQMPRFEIYSSPVGYAVAMIFSGLGQSGKTGFHALFWFSHLFLALGFIAYLPYSKGLHILSGWFNVYSANLEEKGELPPIPKMMERMEAGEDVEMGYKTDTDLTWKERLMLDACTRCGRCQDVCPAYNTGKELNPKQVIQDVRSLMLTKWKNPQTDKCLLQAECGENGAVTSGVLWSCTNCAACMEACPVLVEHVPLIVQMRRELAMEFDDTTPEGRKLFKNMDVNANPWGMAPTDRAAWTEGLDVPTVMDNPDFEYLFFVGCLGCYDPRSIQIAKALVKIFKAADVNFAILGEMELCCGDPIRRLGNEASFQAIVGMTREMLDESELKIRKVITMCPHCFNTLAHEYKDFGLDWEVVHHAEFLDRLIQNGELQLDSSRPMTATVHDSCFLGRYNDLYDEPRRIAQACGAQIIETVNRKENGFCCGGGGGRTWLEEEVERVDDKINVARVTQLAQTGADAFISACPYCMMMFDEGTKLTNIHPEDMLWNRYSEKAQEKSGEGELDLFELVELMDIAELVAQRLVEKDKSG